MKKFFAFAITALAMVVAFSSCKKDEITDAQLAANIASNGTYKGTCIQKGFDDTNAYAAFTKSAATGVQEFALSLESDDPDPSDPTSIFLVGTWEVNNGQLTLRATAVYGDKSQTAIAGGTIEDNGDKFTLESGAITFKDMKKYTAKK